MYYLATQRSLLFSPKSYRELLKPAYKRYFDLIKSKTDASLFYHTDGNVNDLIDDLVEIGVDILNPVQLSAMGDGHFLKKRYGEQISFWGGIDTQNIMPHGSIQEISEEVQQRISEFAYGGGYILSACHNIQSDVPQENIIAMADACQKFGNCPIII